MERIKRSMLDRMYAVAVWTASDNETRIEALFPDPRKAEMHARDFRSMTSDAHVRPVSVMWTEVSDE